MMHNATFVSEFINFFEETEYPVISWGFYNLSLDPHEIENKLQQNASQKLKENGKHINLKLA